MAGTRSSKFVVLFAVAALVATVAFTAASLDTFTSAIPSVQLAKPIGQASEQSYGTLYMDVLLGIKETFYGELSLPTYFKPIAYENVSISLSDAPEVVPLVVSTNSTGLVRVRLPVSDRYVATIEDLRFSISIPFQVGQNETTFIVVRAVRQSFPVQFSEFLESSGVGNGSDGQAIFLRVHSDSSLPNLSGFVFLETSDSTAKSFVDPSSNATVRQVPVKAFQLIGQGGVWLGFHPTDRVAVENVAKLFLVAYTPTYTLTVQRG